MSLQPQDYGPLCQAMLEAGVKLRDAHSYLSDRLQNLIALENDSDRNSKAAILRLIKHVATQAKPEELTAWLLMLAAAAPSSSDAQTLIARLDPSATTASSSSRGDTDPLLGSSLDGRYVVNEKVGGHVYVARDTRLRKNVAIRMVEGLDADSIVDSYRRSIHIPEFTVAITDLFSDAQNTRHFVVMELLHRSNLKDAMSKALPEARLLFAACCDAVARLHGVGHQLHLNIDPKSLLVHRAGSSTRVYLTDFPPMSDRLPPFGKVALQGTTSSSKHIAPELGNGGSVSFATDIYSLAMSFLQVLDECPSRDVEMGVGHRVTQVLGKASSEDPSQRYQSVSAFADALSAAFETDAWALTTLADLERFHQLEEFENPDLTRLHYGFGPERIRSSHSSVSPEFIERALETYGGVARVWVGRGPGAWGTGWLLTPRLFITCWHVLADPLAKDNDYGAVPIGEMRTTAQHVRLHFDNEPPRDGDKQPDVEAPEFVAGFWGSPKLDFVILRLPEGSVERKPLRVSRVALELPDASAYIPANIPQYPGGKDLDIGIRANRLTEARAERITYETDTEGGSSGSPVCDDTWTVRGLHRAGTAGGNRGIQISAILDYLEREEKAVFEEIVHEGDIRA